MMVVERSKLISRIWPDRAGNPTACAEKLKVLEDNLSELLRTCDDALEDAELMGCDRNAALDLILRELERLKR